MGMSSGGGGKTVAFATQIGWESSFNSSDNLGHDEYRLGNVRVLGPLHPRRGLGDDVQEAPHLIGYGPFVLCNPPGIRGVQPEILADRFLQGQKAIHHLELRRLPRVILLTKNYRPGGRLR